MRVRASKARQRNRLARQDGASFRFPVSAFTVFLLIFGLIFWVFHLITLVPHTECQYAAQWIAGWFNFASPFQWFGLAIGLTAVLWVARIVFDRHRLNPFETIFQALLIFFLAAAFLSLKAYLFPYGTPSAAQFDTAAQIAFPRNWRLNEAEDLLAVDFSGWPYNYPAPPEVEFTEHPRWSPAYNPRLPEIFQSGNSPLWSEYEMVQKCASDYQSAVERYQKEQETLHVYWAGFEDWYALNSWRYNK